MRRVLFIPALMVCLSAAAAQSPKLTVEVSNDTILLGNYFALKFIIENTSARGFEAPDLHMFRVISGPNTSTSMSIINGEISQSTAYTYFLEPPEIGVYTIRPAYLTKDDLALETPPIDIIVVPNPEGIIQRPDGPGVRIDHFFTPKPAAEEEQPARPRKKF